MTPGADGLTTLTVNDVTVRFGGVVAVDGVSLSAGSGEIVGIIGPNGAGKTTLFDAIAGHTPLSAGAITFGGRDITRASVVARARLGMRRTFQRMQVFGWLTVEENILAALEWRGGGGGVVADLVAFPTRRRRTRARQGALDEVIERCGLADVRGERAGVLPVGAARMLEFARAVVDRPRALLLDEPTSGLDDREIERLAGLVREVREDGDCAVLLVEHDTRFVMEQSDRLVVLDRGRVLASGAPDEIQADSAVRAAYLGEVAP